MSNPFASQMVKMKFPEGMGESIAIGGFLLTAEADRSTELPRELADTARSHGLVDWVDEDPLAADAARKAKK